MKNEGVLYTALCEMPAPAGLSAMVHGRITALRLGSARRKTFLLAGMSLVFGITLIPALQYAGQEFYASGFYEYMSLLFSDSNFVIGAWREFTFSIIESLPSFALLLLATLSIALLWSVRRAFVNARVAFSF